MFRNDKRERVVASISTLIAEGTTINGDVRFEGGLHLDGRIEGTIAAQAADAVLTLSEKGRIQGDVRVFSAVINGAIEGDLHVVERLELGTSARISGNVHYKVLEMAAGAQINGKMIYEGEGPRRLPSPGDEDAVVAAVAATV